MVGGIHHYFRLAVYKKRIATVPPGAVHHTVDRTPSGGHAAYVIYHFEIKQGVCKEVGQLHQNSRLECMSVYAGVCGCDGLEYCIPTKEKRSN